MSDQSDPLEAVTPLEPACPYIGGKKHLADRLVARIESIPHALYAEPFVGMGGVFLRRRSRPRLEIINDASRDVATFFRVLQRHPRALLEDVMPYAVASRAEFDRLMKVDADTLTDLERAARFYYLQRIAYSGKVAGRTFGVTGEGWRYNYRVRRRHLEALHERLAAVLIECLPWREFVQRYDRADALFYLDPPYWGSEKAYGKDAFRRDEFGTMAGVLRSIAGKFLLSINDTPEIRLIFEGFGLEEVETTYFVGDVDRSEPQRELIISNLPDARSAGRLL